MKKQIHYKYSISFFCLASTPAIPSTITIPTAMTPITTPPTPTTKASPGNQTN